MGKKRLPDGGLPMRQVEGEVEAFTKQWWKCATLQETGLSLAAVVCDAQFQVCRYIKNRMDDPQTPDEVKDAFAMRSAPNLGVIFKHEGSNQTQPQHDESPPDKQSATTALGVFGAYGLKTVQ